ncbi:MAG: hypothetical protein SNJ69_09030 [Chloroflexaceae bacterium]
MTAITHFALQDFPWLDSIAMVKASEQFDSYEAFHRYVNDNLRHNSAETRRRYAQLLQRRFFPDRSLDSLVPVVWRQYHDQQLLEDCMRVTALEGEPTVAAFIVENILPLAPGAPLLHEAAREFIERSLGEYKPKSHERLLRTCRLLGFLSRDREGHVAALLRPSPDALLILLHDRLAPAPRIVRLQELLASPWWRYLGLRDPDEV